jgi:putative ABC transport system permease protein
MVTIALRGVRAHLRRVLAAAVAIVLGVGFLTATLVLGDSMRAGFASSFVAGNDGTAVVVRSDARFGNADMVLDEGTVPVDLLDELLLVPGVAAGAIHVDGLAQIVAADGTPLGGDGPPTLGSNWIDEPRLSPWRLSVGRAPLADGEVVIDRASARAGNLDVGSITTIRTPHPTTVTVVGIATFGAADSQGPTTQVLFDTDTAQRLLVGEPDRATTLRLAATPGVDHDELAGRIEAILPAGAEVITGAELSAEQMAELEADFLGAFQGLLLAFAAVGLVVATLTIHNTLSIIVAQRSRESALLRALGASRRQVIGMVAGESLGIGVIASALGLGAGLGLAALALWGMSSAGFGAPGGMQWSTTSLVVGLLVGVIVTAAATIVPAVAASRIAPLAAVRANEIEQPTTSRLRLVAALVAGAVAAASVGAASRVDGSELAITGLGILAAIVALLLAGPTLAGPVARSLGWPLARLRGRPGELARRNAVRNPRRTAGTATSLMIGVGVVVLFLAIASSMTAYLDRTLAGSFRGDLVIDTDSFSGPGLSPELGPAVEALDEVDRSVALGMGVARFGDDVLYPMVADPVGLIELFDLEVVDGSATDAARNGVAVSRRFADDHGLAVGDPVALTVGAAGRLDHTVGAIYAQRDVMGDLLVARQAWSGSDAPLSEQLVMIRLAPEVDPVVGRAAVAAVAEGLAAPSPMDRGEYVDQVAGELDQILAMVVALMAVAVLIAVMGIGNTMSLSIHERTRELGLLRAVGMSRAGVRAAVRWESVIVATFGGVTGAALGTFAAWAVLRAIEAAGEIPVGFAVPTASIAIVVGLGALSGVAAGFRPARRAARVDILDALASA